MLPNSKVPIKASHQITATWQLYCKLMIDRTSARACERQYWPLPAYGHAALAWRRGRNKHYTRVLHILASYTTDSRSLSTHRLDLCHKA